MSLERVKRSLDHHSRAALPPGHVLAVLGEALGASVDELVGNKLPAKAPRSKTSRPLLRRLEHLEKLPLKDKRELLVHPVPPVPQIVAHTNSSAEKPPRLIASEI
jgi:hypothetical protein